MNELTDQLKLSRIPDEEIGLRIRAVILFFAHFYVLGIVVGEILQNIIDTTKQLLIQNKWHEQFQEQNEWVPPLYSAAPTMTNQASNLQPNSEGSTAPISSENYSSEKRSLHQVASKTPRLNSKPRGFANV